ncbi:MAG: tRNA (adenosine(37)-N6)-dimethylallyltransferase MiaA [Actinobacteria bacterium]|nr:tRNA (adenosine(37)-N6)-dimethylallyltransferase MiaA [Actinomycetota bacterium]
MGHVVLLGPTASGKSALAMQIAAQRDDVEIIAVDSMQVYRGMDIGTAKPTVADRAAVPHHGLDLADPSEDFTVTRYRDAFDAALAAIEQRGHRALLVAGTGLYLRAVTDRLDIPGQWPDVRRSLEADPDTEALHARLAQLDPDAAARMTATNRRRVVRALEVTLGSGRAFSSFGDGLTAYGPAPFRFVGVDADADALAARIDERLETMLAAGFIDEVHGLQDQLSRTAAQALGYREVLAHLRGELTLDDAIALIGQRTRRLARRQRAWFRRDPRVEWRKPVEVAGAVLGDWDRCRNLSTRG